MSWRDARKYRKVAKRCNFLALDRPDIVYAAKEASKTMSEPKEADWVKLERLARHLKQNPRLVYKYRWQARENILAMPDADWAGCKISGKSTPGELIMRGTHLIKTWSQTQRVFALSTGEAELLACVKASAQAISIQSTAKDCATKLATTTSVDARAAHGMRRRRGAGNMRHVATSLPWVQEAAQTRRIKFVKVDGRNLPADLITKPTPGETI